VSKTFFGHPPGLSILFFTELWERFSYYGMRALLLLFMITAVEKGGLGFDEGRAGAIYGLYTMAVYLFALPGGWIADQILGLRKAIFAGGCIIAIGHFCLIFTSVEIFLLGLFLIAVGTGMLKPNISSMVGDLYGKDEHAKRDAGFSIFFLGINIGAFVAPVITGYLGEKINWHYGFASAGVGMVIGLIQFKLAEKTFGQIGLPPGWHEASIADKKRQIVSLLSVLIATSVVAILLVSGLLRIDPVVFADAAVYIILTCVAGYFTYLFFFGKLDSRERKGVTLIFIFFLASMVFYFGYEQQGSSLNLFADRYTDMFIGTFEMPASWMQSLSPIAVIVFAPTFAWLWVILSRRHLDPSINVKLWLGLLFLGLGYIVMMVASQRVAQGNHVLPYWLIATYVLHTFGEICLYPIGLSAVTKLSPKRLAGRMMGIWFMSLALGNLLAGLYASTLNATRIANDPQLLSIAFRNAALIILGAAVIMIAFSTPIKRLLWKSSR
jgi:POT family proton-dependent oligopeptide transporter